jgi:hypothetical protein
MIDINFNYSFFNDNDKNKENIVEGMIPNFCSLNRGSNNRFNAGYSRLENAIDNKKRQSENAKYSSTVNRKTNETAGTTSKIGSFNSGCSNGKKIKGIIYDTNGVDTVVNGYAYMISLNYFNDYGKVTVDQNGKFSDLMGIIPEKNTKFTFAYEDNDLTLWSLVLKDSKDQLTLDCDLIDDNTTYELQKDKILRKGYKYDGRDANGKLINTEIKNSGAESRFFNLNKLYKETYMNTINLGVGVLAAIIFIMKDQ